MLRLHQWTIERLPAAVGPVPIGERIALVRAAMALSGGVAAVVRGRYLRGSDEGRGGDQGGGEGESGNEGFHFAVSFVTDDRPFGLAAVSRQRAGAFTPCGTDRLVVLTGNTYVKRKSPMTVGLGLTSDKGERIPPRARILAVAGELFYRHGIRAVGVDAIAEAAGTNKMTLYRHFASKDELVAEYLRQSARLADAGWDRLAAAHPGDVLAQLRGWLAEMADHLANADERGCPLANAAVELPEKDHPARRVMPSRKQSAIGVWILPSLMKKMLAPVHSATRPCQSSIMASA